MKTIKINEMEILKELLVAKEIKFDDGLTDIEVKKIEEKFNIIFPPDLKSFLQLALPVSKSFVNWRDALKSEIVEESILFKLDWPLSGMLFDLEHNNFWLKAWGNKPEMYKVQGAIVKEKYLTFPKLIPIYSHRYIPMTPSEENNPIFSVHQMDIIYYGHNLISYFANEFKLELPEELKSTENYKNIEFWSDFVEGNLEEY